MGRTPSTLWAQRALEPLLAPVAVSFTPKFQLKGRAVFCIGSCFARNVEEYLERCKVNVLSIPVISPLSEFGGRPRGVVNKYNAFSIANELQWLLNDFKSYQEVVQETSQGYRDLHLGRPPVKSLDRLRERRRYLAWGYFNRVFRAEAFIVTFGLSEVWQSAVSGIMLNSTPDVARGQESDFSCTMTSVRENIDVMSKIVEQLCAIAPKCRIVLTVSPVPMSATFVYQDVLLANFHNKSNLLIAARETALTHECVDYYPSYEMCTASTNGIFGPDRRHVKEEVVREIARDFAQRYLDEDVPDIEFSEIAYLEANPDVEDQVRGGSVRSGYSHWQIVGRAEGRPTKPYTPSPRLLRLGA